jgi:hypothetical protein
VCPYSSGFSAFFFGAILLVNLGGKKIAYIVAALMSLIYVVLPMPELLWGINRVFKYISMLWVCSWQEEKQRLRIER